MMTGMREWGGDDIITLPFTPLLKLSLHLSHITNSILSFFLKKVHKPGINGTLEFHLSVLLIDSFPLLLMEVLSLLCSGHEI